MAITFVRSQAAGKYSSQPRRWGEPTTEVHCRPNRASIACLSSAACRPGKISFQSSGPGSCNCCPAANVATLPVRAGAASASSTRRLRPALPGSRLRASSNQALATFQSRSATAWKPLRTRSLTPGGEFAYAPAMAFSTGFDRPDGTLRVSTTRGSPDDKADAGVAGPAVETTAVKSNPPPLPPPPRDLSDVRPSKSNPPELGAAFHVCG